MSITVFVQHAQKKVGLSPYKNDSAPSGKPIYDMLACKIILMYKTAVFKLQLNVTATLNIKPTKGCEKRSTGWRKK